MLALRELQMLFPLDYRGEIDWISSIGASAAKSKSVFLNLMPIELRSIGLQRVFVQGDKISFGRGTPQYFSLWNILTALDKGEIEVVSRNDRLIVSYHLSFRGFFILMLVGSFILLILWILIDHPPLAFVIMMGVFIFLGLATMSLNCRMVVRKFLALIKRLLISI